MRMRGVFGDVVVLYVETRFNSPCRIDVFYVGRLWQCPSLESSVELWKEGAFPLLIGAFDDVATCCFYQP